MNAKINLGLIYPVNPTVLVYVLLALCLGCFSTSTDSIPAPPPLPPPPDETVELVCSFFQLALFPGCEYLEQYGERKACADDKARGYIYQHATYPAEAVAAGAEGAAVVSFIVKKDGSMGELTLLRDPGYGMGAAALAVFETMKVDNIRWEPGRASRGAAEPARMQMNYPVMFRYNRMGTPSSLWGVYPPRPDTTYRIVDQPPILSMCDSLVDRQAKKQCSDLQLLSFIMDELRIPPEIAQNCFAGTIIVEFVVNKYGWVQDAAVLRSPHKGLVPEVMKVMKQFAEQRIHWEPGRLNGKPVAVTYTIPIKIHWK